MRLLITRPYNDSIRTKKLIEENTHHKVSISPALKITYSRKNLLLSDDSKIIVTSANGIKALSKATTRRDMEVYVVGYSSLLKAEEFGFKNIKYDKSLLNDSNSINLAKYIISTSEKYDEFIHVTSPSSSGELSKLLENAGLKYSVKYLYKTTPLPISKRVKDSLKKSLYDGFLFFSRASAQYFLEALQKEGLEKSLKNKKIFCLSPAISDVFKRNGYIEMFYPDEINIKSFVGILGKQND